MASKLPPAVTMSLKRFMLRQEVLSLFRKALRASKMVADASQRQQLREWVKTEFRNNTHYQDEEVIKMLLTQGKRSLQELQSTLKRMQ